MHSTFRDQERVIEAIAQAAKDRVRVLEIGKSTEGRPLRLIVVSSPANIARLETIRTQIGKLADPRLMRAPEEAETIARSTPILTWINHCIHGNETASFETVMWTLYTLAASEAPAITEALKNSVVILNPVFNPDGHERCVVYYNSVAVGSPESISYEHHEPWAIEGRYNHYRFDMNRDKLAQSQLETQLESAAFLHWRPQVYADEHGQPETYFFPPTSLPTNRNIDRARVEKWTDIFGRANGTAFDRYGWEYVNRETYDFFYPGYLDTWSTLAGAIGMTYETDGGGNLARRRKDETISTLRDAVAHHFETSLSTILTAVKHRVELLRDYTAYRRSALEEGEHGKLRRVVIVPGSDPSRAAEFSANLLHAGIEVKVSQAPFRSATAHTYLPEGKPGSAETAKVREFPVGSLIVEMAQPEGHMARAFLEPDPDFEPDFVKEQYTRRERNEKKNENESKEDYEFYDITGWALPFSYNLEACWTEDASPVESRLLTLDAKNHVTLPGLSGGIQGGKAKVAYLFRYDCDNAAALALRLLQEGYRLSAATKPVRVGGQEWPRGTLIAMVSRNLETLHSRINALATSLGVTVYAMQAGYGDTSHVGLGSRTVQSVKAPAVAVVEDDMVDQTSFGAVWYLFERKVGLRFTPLRLSALRSADLSRFNVLIFPDGSGYANALGKAGMVNLKEWAQRGNVLIGLGGGSEWLLDKEVGISTAAPVGQDEKSEETKAGDGKSAEKPNKPVELAGSIFRARIDPTHFLGFGYERGEIAVPLEGSTFLKPSKQGANVVTFDKGPLRLSGFAWPNNTEALLANTAYVIDEPLGEGHAIIFLEDPTFRALWPGLRRCFLSGILFGPTRNALTSVQATQ